MANRSYVITQQLNDGEKVVSSKKIPPLAGTYRVGFYLSDGRYINAGDIVSNSTVEGLRHKIEIEMGNDEPTVEAYFNSHYGLQMPKYVSSKYTLDNTIGAYWGNITITNPNTVTVECEVDYKWRGLDNYTYSMRRFTIGAGETYTINFSDIYADGICAIISFCDYAHGINGREVYLIHKLGNYVGNGFTIEQEEEEETSTTTTTTTTTTVDSNSVEPTLVESDGKFELWRLTDVK